MSNGKQVVEAVNLKKVPWPFEAYRSRYMKMTPLDYWIDMHWGDEDSYEVQEASGAFEDYNILGLRR